MPPKRKTARNAQHQPQPTVAIQSDYETDTANYTDSQSMAIVPPPPVRSNAELNLLVLRRWCPEIEGIIAVAPFAVLYIFSPETQGWEKCETQGSLFVCQLGGELYPRYRVVILNRKNPENFQLDIVSTENIEITEEYVIVQIVGDDGTPHIYGIWIFSDGDSVPDTREVIAKTIMDCAMRAEQDALDAEGQHEQDGQFESRTEPEVNLEPTAPRQQLAGQQIDFATLFAKPPMQPGGQIQPLLQPHGISGPQHTYEYAQSQQFGAPENFQRHQTAHQAAPPPSQQNALLDLFKNAKRG
ncbi:decapping enzyme Dcp1 like protein [Zymoseptoria brevis]|uniref:Decapping enzyme Dcp1 like protein n=1 Tax=Zymoseptoria brevis TaxID=1047168 RepID=A0A0F4GRJ8_9PEZI|nr:decapping enzyme Dcp1 like protein [Zymoseptoria brevis]